MAIQYHKLLDRILVRRAGERESLQRQVDENRPMPKVMMALLCISLAGLFTLLGILPVSLILLVGAVLSAINAFATWKQAAKADAALDNELQEEEYRRYLLGKLGPQRFDQLAGAVAAGGSDASIQGWLKPLDFDAHDIEYLLWLAENIVAQVREGVEAVGGMGPGRGAGRTPSPPAGKAPEKTAAESLPQPATLPKPELRNLSPEEIEKFKRLASQRKAEFERWEQAGGGRSGAPDDPLGKLGAYTPAQLEELKKKARERRERGKAPKSTLPAPAAKDHPGNFTEEELKELERAALSRFEPRPRAGQEQPNKSEVLGQVFSPEDIQALAAKIERQARERSPAKESDGKALPAADESDWDSSAKRD